MRVNRPVHRKGIGLKFPNWDLAAGGNANEPGDAGGSPGEVLFSFSLRALESVSRDRAQRLVKHCTSRSVGALPTAREKLGKPRYRPSPLVLITASGLKVNNL